MKRGLILIGVVAGLTALAACTEKPQTLDSGVKLDAKAFQGTGLPYAVPGWKQGDAASWEQQVKNRTQTGQNEYNRVH